MSNRDSHYESHLLELIKEGDSNAFNSIVEHYRKYLFVHAFHKIDDYEDAKDIVQDVFVSIWTQRRRLDPTVSLRSYMLGVLRNKCMDYLRKHYKEKRREFHPQEQSLVSNNITTIEAKEMGLHIDAAITKLSPSRRSAFEKKYKDQKSNKEIALMMGIKTQAVKNLLSEALKRLREELKPKYSV